MPSPLFFIQFSFKLFLTEQAPVEENKLCNSVPADPLPQSEALNAGDDPVDNNIAVVKDVEQLQVSLMFHWCVFLQLD